jgi:hypothetical protein
MDAKTAVDAIFVGKDRAYNRQLFNKLGASHPLTFKLWLQKVGGAGFPLGPRWHIESVKKCHNQRSSLSK